MGSAFTVVRIWNWNNTALSCYIQIYDSSNSSGDHSEDLFLRSKKNRWRTSVTSSIWSNFHLSFDLRLFRRYISRATRMISPRPSLAQPIWASPQLGLNNVFAQCYVPSINSFCTREDSYPIHECQLWNLVTNLNRAIPKEEPTPNNPRSLTLGLIFLSVRDLEFTVTRTWKDQNCRFYKCSTEPDSKFNVIPDHVPIWNVCCLHLGSSNRDWPANIAKRPAPRMP